MDQDENQAKLESLRSIVIKQIKETTKLTQSREKEISGKIVLFNLEMLKKMALSKFNSDQDKKRSQNCTSPVRGLKQNESKINITDIPSNNPPQISAKAWSITTSNTNRSIMGKNEKMEREIASITKIMTCYLSCQIMEEHGLDPFYTYVQVSPYASTITGTSAFLRKGQYIRLYDLLHGLMLPSGNDAAIVLAENFGTYLYLIKERKKFKSLKEVEITGNPINSFV